MVKNSKNLWKKVKTLFLTTLMAFSSGATFISTATPVYASADYGSLSTLAQGHIGATYSAGSRLGPNSFDCSGLVDYVWNEAGIGSEPLSGGWTTATWHNYLMGMAGVTYTDTTQDSYSPGDVHAGDIIMWYNDAAKTSINNNNPYHMGIMVNSTQMVSAITRSTELGHGGVVINNIVGGTSGGHYQYDPLIKGGLGYIRIFHFPTTKNLTVKVHKYSANTDLTDGNNCYTLEGAVFGIYSDANCTNEIGSITTDANGNGTKTVEVDADVSSLWVKEKQASKGFLLNSTPYQASFSGTNDAEQTVNVPETPKDDPIGISIYKKDWDGSPNRSLAGAKYTVKFWKGTKATTENPDAIWYFQSVDFGKGNYGWRYNDTYYGSYLGYEGHDRYTNNGQIALPYGTMTIEETDAPEGYTLKDSYVTVDGDVKDFGATVDSSNVITTVITDASDGKNLYIKVDQEASEELKQNETPQYGNFDIYKGETDDTSAFTRPESDVQFVAILNTVIGEGKAFKTYKEAYEKIMSQVTLEDDGKTVKERVNIVDDSGNVILSKTEYDVLVTGENGKASSRNLAYGSYTVRQTSKSAGLVSINWNDINGQATFVVDHNRADDEEPTHLYAVNTEQHYYLRLVKKDADTNSTVSLTGTSFKIKMLEDKNGNDVSKLTEDFTLSGTSEKMHIENGYVTFELAGKKYNTFSTNNDGDVIKKAPSWANEEDDKGTVTTPLKLAGGKYQIEEVKTADGYLKLESPIVLSVNESTITEKTEDGGKLTQEVVIKNEQPKGKLVVKKNVNKWKEADQTLIDYDKVYTQIQFTLYAAEDIKDPATGKTLAKKNTVAANIYGEKVGEFYLNEDGTYTLKDLPMGKYYLQETKVPNGLLLDDTKYDVVFTQEDQEVVHKEYKVIFDDDATTSDWSNGTKVTAVGNTLQNSPTHTVISKKSVTGQNELPGATLSIYDGKELVKDASGNPLTWTSGEDEYLIEGLTAGKTYTLVEDLAPLGYAKATAIDFTINPNGTVNKVQMIDKQVISKKLDMCGNAVESAEITIYELDNDKDGNVITDDNGDKKVIDKWTTTSEEHYINNLEVGKTYLAVETVTPEGYAKMVDYQFTVLDDKQNQEEDFIDKRVEISKVDAGGEEVEGAKLTITDKATGKVVDEWTSGKETHYANNLEVGKTYILTEDTTPAGYVKATEIEFTVTDNGVDQKVTMVDDVIDVEKLDEEGNQLDGAKFSVVDKDGNEVDTWTSGEHIVDITNEQKDELETGKTVEFTKDGKIYKVVAIEETSKDKSEDGDKQVVSGVEDKTEEACKVDTTSTDDVDTQDLDDGVATKPTEDQPVDTDYSVDDPAEKADEGDELDPDFSVKSYKYTVMVTDEEGNVSYYNIDTNGDETSHRISGLVFGEKYTIKETYSPDGYFYVKDTEFTANKTNTITLTDNDIVYQINKVDNVDGSYVKGVQLKLIDITDKENQTEVELPNGGVTTGEAIILDKVLIADHTYNLIETELVGGVWRSTNIQFTVPHNAVEGMKTITVTMVDDITNTGIAKVDEDGNYVEGAKMQLIEIKSDLQNAAADGSEEEIDKDYLIDSEDATTDEVSNEDKGIATLNETGEDKAVADETTATDGEDAVATKPDEDTDIDTDFSQGTVVYEWTTSDKLEDVSKYVKGGYTYIVREVEAPFGFEVMKDIEFTSTGTVDEKQVIVATDQRKTYYVSGVKVDADDTSKYLEGAELTLYTADGKVAKDVNGKDCKATTVKNGVVTFEVEYNDDLFKNAKAGYYLKETKSPKHYQLNKNKFYVELSTDYSFAVNNPVKIIVKDKYDNYKKTAAGFGVGLGAIALASGAGIIATRKKKKDEEINENVD